MHLQSFRVENFRRLKDVRVNLEDQSTIFVGANNSGKTSATHIFQLFLDNAKHHFQIYDFTADCWGQFDTFSPDNEDPMVELPTITFDLWFTVDENSVHRVVDLLPSLDWDGEPVGVRMVYAPRDLANLVANYKDALKAAQPKDGSDTGSYEPWPINLTDYLTKRLVNEYEIKYYLLDRNKCSNDLRPQVGYDPFLLGTAATGAAGIVDGLIRVDFLNAQRHLADTESHGRAEDLSKRLSRFYQRNLQKIETDLEALSAITEAEARLNDHFENVFRGTLESVSQLGYPGISNPGLVVKAAFNPHNILTTSARVHYALPDPSPGVKIATTLPDQYNGLGFKKPHLYGG